MSADKKEEQTMERAKRIDAKPAKDFQLAVVDMALTRIAAGVDPMRALDRAIDDLKSENVDRA